MVAILEKARESFAAGDVDWDANTIKAALLDLSNTDTAVKAITGATNASPIVVTAVGHGFTGDDIVYIGGVGGNLAANGLWKIASPAADTFQLTRPDGGTSVGSGAYTSGGYAVCLGPSAAGDMLDDFDGCRVAGSTDQTLTPKTNTAGVLDADDLSYSAVPTGDTVHAVLIYQDTGVASTSRALILHTGTLIVTCAAAALTGATVLAVEPLAAAIASGAVLTFSDGTSATLSGAAAAGDRTLTVTGLAAGIAAGARALATASGSGFPLATNGGAITVAWSSGTNRIAKL